MARTTPVNSGYSIINGTTSGANGGTTDTWIEWAVTDRSITNNTSTVRAILYSQNTAGKTSNYSGNAEYGWVSYNNGTKQWLTISGYNYANYNINKFADHTWTIAHNDDGTKTISLQGQFTTKSSWITGGSVNGNVTLPRIARASTISNVSTNLGSQATVTITRQSSDFTHTISYKVGSASAVTIATKTTATSVNFTPDVSLISQFGADSKTATGTITCTTYSGNTSVGTSTSTLTLTIPNSSLWNASGTFGSALTLTATNACSSGLTYTYAYYNGSSWVGIGSSSNKTQSWTPNTSLIANVSNASSGTFNIRVITKRGTTEVNTATATATISIPKNTSQNISATIGSAVSIPISKAHSNLTTTITYSFGSSGTTTIVSQTTSTNYSWTPSTSLLTQIPNSTSGTGSITITTYNGTAPCGSNTYTLTLSAANSVVPTSSLSLAMVNNDSTVNSWGIYLQGYSQVRATLTGSGVSGSTIKSMTISGTGLSSSGSYSSSSATLTGTSSVLQTSGRLYYRGNVSDSRNRSATEQTKYIDVISYSQPSVSGVSLVRSNAQGNIDTSGTWLKVAFTLNYSTADGHNSASVSLRYKEATASSWTTYGAVTNGANLNLNLDISKNYQAQLLASDSLNSNITSSTFNIPSAERVLNVNGSGSGLAIGGFSTDAGKFQVYYPADFESNTLPTINTNPFVAEAKGFALFGGTEIPNNSDLNDDTFMDAGTWYCQTNAIANTLTNCPTGYAFRMVVAKTLRSMEKVGSGNNWNGSQQTIYDYMGNVYSRYIYYADTDTDKRIGVWYGGLKDNTTVGNLGWSGYRANGVNIPTLNTLAYWNGAYTGTTSNLEYFGSNALNNLTNHGTFSGSNVNDCLTLGLWLINPSTTTTNLPYSDWGFLRVERQASNYIQTFFRLYGQNTFVRIYANGDWRGWRELGNGVDGGTYNWVTATGSNVTLTGSTANDLCTLTVPQRDVWLVEGYCKVTATASANTKVELYLNNYWSNHRVGAWIPYTNTPLYMQYNHVAWGTDISSAIHLALWHSADVSVSDILLRFYKIQSTALT